MFKRTLAILLVLAALLSLGPAAVLADEGADETAPVPETEVPPTAEPEPSDEPEPSEEPEPSDEPGPTEEPEPSDEPEPTAEPAVPPTAEPGPSEEPEPSEEPVAPPAESTEPEVSPEPSEEPEVSPEPSEEPDASPEPSEEPTRKVWPWTEPGNSSAALMGGGWTLDDGSAYYISSGGLYLYQGSNGTLLSSANAENLNLSGGWLYYTAGSGIWRMNPTGGGEEQVYACDAAVDQMYVMGQEIRFLSSGCVYSLDLNDGAVEALEAPSGVKKFLPTPYGNLFLTGELFHYDLLAGGVQLLSNVDSCYIEGEWLTVVNADGTWQTSLSGLFSGSAALQPYSLHQSEVPAGGMSEEQELASESAYLASAEYAALQELAASGSGYKTASTSHVLTKDLTANQQNIVLRAEQMAEVTWTALGDRYGWRGNEPGYAGPDYIKDINGVSSGSVNGNKSGIFLMGHTYKGVPYCMAVNGKYVGWGVSLAGFLEGTEDVKSVFYKQYCSYNGHTGPYYGSDCSGFVSYAWDLPSRCTCSGIAAASNATKIADGTESDAVTKLQVGDAINNIGSHVMLVTDIGYDSKGKIVSVEITEQTPPKMRVTCYGEPISGKSYDRAVQPLSNLTSAYLRLGGYDIYRRSCRSKPNVGRPDDVVGLSKEVAPTMSVAPAGPGKLTVTLSHEKSAAVIYYTTDGSTPKVGESTKYSGPFTLTQSCTVRAVASVGAKESFPMISQVGASGAPTLGLAGSPDGDGVFLYNNEYYVASGKKLTLNVAGGGTVYYSTSGDPTISSTSAASGAASITVTDGMTIKAFACCDGCLPSAVVSYTVRSGAMHTITVDDPYGLVTQGGAVPPKQVNVLSGADVTFKVSQKAKNYELDYVILDGTTKKEWKDIVNGEITFPKVSGDHSIKTFVKTPFNDLTQDWYKQPVAFAYANGLMGGTSPGVFSPTFGANRAVFITVLGRYDHAALSVASKLGKDANESNSKNTVIGEKTVDAATMSKSYKYGITRGEDINVRASNSTSSAVTAMLVASEQIVEVTETTSNGWYKVRFSDTGESGYVSRINPSNNKVLLDVCSFNDITAGNVNYCYGYVQWAYINGITKGISSAKFGATNGISRQDICVILYNYLKYKGYKLDTSDAKAKTFSDYSSVSSYAREGVCAMVNAGIINGSGGKLQPKAIAWRCHVAQFIYNLDQFING